MTQVGRYQILEELGRGAMGVVYKALDPAIGRTIAIKAIRLTDLTNADERQRLRERLLQGAQSVGVLSHPSIVIIYDILEQEDFAYIFMEYVPGASLERMLSKGSLPTGSELIDYLRQVAEALDYAHRKGILHRNIKPANIIISDGVESGERLAKVADFGIARFATQAITQTETVTGTPNYMSPEQIQGTTVAARSDQFSLGVVAYELLTGTKPFIGEDLAGLFYSICKQDPIPAQEVNSSLSEASGKVLQRALMKDAAERFGSCGEFAGALSIALAESPAWIAGKREHAIATESGPATPFNNAGPIGAVGERPWAAAARTGPIISIPENNLYDIPSLPKRRRNERDLPLDESAQRSSISRKLGLILAMCFAIVATIVFIVRSNSGPALPVQVLDTKSGPTIAPPEGMEVMRPERPAVKPDKTSGMPSGPQRARGQELAARTQSIAGGDDDVELLTEPPGARVVIDGRADLACDTPCTLSLHGGRHTLSAELSGYSIARRIFSVPSDTSLLMNMNKSLGVLLVTSFPRTACKVFVDGRPSGETPATLHLTAGTHQVGVAGLAAQQEQTIEVQTDGFDMRRFPCQ